MQPQTGDGFRNSRALTEPARGRPLDPLIEYTGMGAHTRRLLYQHHTMTDMVAGQADALRPLVPLPDAAPAVTAPPPSQRPSWEATIRHPAVWQNRHVSCQSSTRHKDERQRGTDRGHTGMWASLYLA